MWDYSDEVKKHFLDPQNVGIIDNADGVGEVGSLACGDALKLTFKLNNEGLIEDAKFQTFGCASAIASSSALTEMLKGKTIEEASKITNKDIVDYLGGLPKEKIHCSVMGQDALKKAIFCYKGGEKKLIEDEIVCECFEISDAQIESAIKKENLSTIDEVSSSLKAGTSCGNCRDKIQTIIERVNGKSLLSSVNSKALTNVQKIKMIEVALEKDIRPALMKDGGDIDLVEVDGNKVFVKLRGACVSCSKSHVTLKHYVETKLREIISPDLIVEEA